MASTAHSFLRKKADLVEIWAQRRTSWGYAFDNRTVYRVIRQENVRVIVRLHQGDRIEAFEAASLDLSDLEDALSLARPEATLSPSDLPFEVWQEGPSPVSYDRHLHALLDDQTRFRELAESLSANVWHEGERIPGISRFSGSMSYSLTETVVIREAGSLRSRAGALCTEIDFNECFGEQVVQVQAPESFLPTALIGARTWRNAPKLGLRGPSGYSTQLSGEHAIVLHPRVTEKLLRGLGPHIFKPGGFTAPIGTLLACDNFTLIDDPRLDGLVTSRAFDDTGTATGRLALVVDGKLVRHFRTQPARREQAGYGSGHHWHSINTSDATLEPALTFSSLLVNRGDTGFHKLLARTPGSLLINDVDNIEVLNSNEGYFRARIKWAVALREGAPNVAIPRSTLFLTGRLFSVEGRPPGILKDASLSHELHDTGSSVLPYVFSRGMLSS